MNLEPNEIKQIKNEFHKAYNFDIRGLRKQKETSLNELARAVGIKNSFINKAYILWYKQND